MDTIYEYINRKIYYQVCLEGQLSATVLGQVELLVDSKCISSSLREDTGGCGCGRGPVTRGQHSNMEINTPQTNLERNRHLQ